MTYLETTAPGDPERTLVNAETGEIRHEPLRPAETTGFGDSERTYSDGVRVPLDAHRCEELAPATGVRCCLSEGHAGEHRSGCLATRGKDGRTYIEGRPIAEHRRMVQVTATLALEEGWRRALMMQGEDPAASPSDMVASALMKVLRSELWSLYAIDVAVTR